MAKDGNTYAKRQRETLKRQKAEAKRDRRRKRKDAPISSPGMGDHNLTSADIDDPPRDP
jgi:hypothetical protein